MAQYHGDLSQFSDSIYRSSQDKSYIIAILLAFFLGFTGIHRFYLGQQKWGFFHLLLCFGAVMVAIPTFSFKLLFVLLGVQSLILLGEIVWLMVQFLSERTG